MLTAFFRFRAGAFVMVVWLNINYIT